MAVFQLGNGANAFHMGELSHLEDVEHMTTFFPIGGGRCGWEVLKPTTINVAVLGSATLLDDFFFKFLESLCIHIVMCFNASFQVHSLWELPYCCDRSAEYHRQGWRQSGGLPALKTMLFNSSLPSSAPKLWGQPAKPLIGGLSQPSSSAEMGVVCSPQGWSHIQIPGNL